MTNLIVIGVSTLLSTNHMESVMPPGPDGRITVTVHSTVVDSASVTCRWNGVLLVLTTNVPKVRTTRQYRKNVTTNGIPVWEETDLNFAPTFEFAPPPPPQRP